MGKYFALLALSITATMVSVTTAYSQCAMCKAVAEESINESGYGIAMGLNTGILFIMSIPYVLLALIVVVFFRKQVKGFIKAFSNIH